MAEVDQTWGKDKSAELEKTVRSIWEKVPYAHEKLNFAIWTHWSVLIWHRERYNVWGGPAKKKIKKSNLSLILPVDLQQFIGRIEAWEYFKWHRGVQSARSKIWEIL